jgi:soluble lytic murein transglycosylase
VENIPFRETRHYTERVLTYAVIYDLRLGNEVIGLDQRMPPVQPPATSVAEAPGLHNPSL